MSKREFSIALWISAALVVVTTVLVGTMGVRSVIVERKQQRAVLRNDLDLTTSELAVGLSLPLWNFDRPQLDRLMESAMERQDVYSVEVTQSDASTPGGVAIHRRVRTSEGKSSAIAEDTPPQDLLVSERDVLSSEGPIGKVRVSVTPRFFEAQQRARLVTLLVQIAALDVLLILGLYFLLWRIVIKPIQVLEGYAQAMSAGRPLDRATSRLASDGTHFYGELESLRASIASTFELLEARYDALRKNEAMLSSILNSVPQSIFWKSQTGVYLGCNEVFAKAAGFPDPATVVGKTDFDLPWPSEHVESNLAEDRRVVETGLPQSHIIARLQADDGSSHWIDTTKVPLRDPNGQVYGVLGVYDDVTERKRAEAERLELEAQLRQSQKMEAIGTLAGGIAHDFNNLLSAIRGNAELAALQIDSGHRAHASIAEIVRASKRATDLVRQIVGFSRPAQETGEIVNLRQLVEEVMGLMRSLLPAGVQLSTECPGPPPYVLAAASQLHQVLVNLLTNAWQAMESRPGHIEVRLEQRTLLEPLPRGLEPGTYACISVSDNGKGMAPEVRDRIFEPFFTTKARGHGTGLGLSTVRGIVTAHHGVIEVESTSGVGSRFIIYLPVTEPQALAEPEPAGSPAAAHVTQERQRVYYVDDEKALVYLVTRQLELCGHEVHGFTSAEAALEAIKADPSAFDVLVTDYNMPRMPGLELITEVLALRPDARVVLTTGYISDDIKAAADKLHVKWLIDKPSSVEDLCDAIHRSALATGPDQESK